MNMHRLAVEGYPDGVNERDFAQMVLLSIPRWIYGNGTSIILQVGLRVHDGKTSYPHALFANEDCYPSVDGRQYPYINIAIVYQPGIIFTPFLADKMAREASVGIDKIIEEAPWYHADVS